MVLIGHGTDLSLGPTIGPLVNEQHLSVRSAIGRIAKAQYTAVQLDATLSGIRPRDLSRRGRKDLSAVVNRGGVSLAGLDFLIPRSHFHDPGHVDRAMSATVAVIELAADLGRVPLSLNLPVEQMGQDAKSALVEAADGHSITLAVFDHTHPHQLLEWIQAVDLPALGAGLDPADLIAQGMNPVEQAHQFGDRLRVARLNDLDRASDNADPTSQSPIRCRAGSGQLDLQAYRVALDLSQKRMGPVILDLRGLSDLSGALSASRSSWEDAAFSV